MRGQGASRTEAVLPVLQDRRKLIGGGLAAWLGTKQISPPHLARQSSALTGTRRCTWTAEKKEEDESEDEFVVFDRTIRTSGGVEVRQHASVGAI